MSTETEFDSAIKQLPEAAKEAAERAARVARELAHDVHDLSKGVTDATRELVHQTGESAREMYQTAAMKAGDALSGTRDCLRRKPVTVVLGALLMGAAVGYLIMSARRRPTFSERYEEEPLAAMREALLSAISPVTHRVHQGYDTALDGVGKAMERVHHFRPGRAAGSLSEQIGRVGNHLKFW